MNTSKKSFIGGIALGVTLAVMTTFSINTFNTIVSGASDSVIIKVNYIKEALNSYYMGDMDDSAMNEGIYKGMVASLNDPYTVYFDSKEYASFMADSDGTFSGIGVTVTANKADNTILIISVFEGTPSEGGGLLPGDKIIKVNGIDMTGDKMDEAVDMMKGEQGTPVTVTIYRESDHKTFDATMNREIVEVPTVSYEMLEDNIGYIQLTSFDGVTYDQFKKAYDSLNQAGQKSLIIDLRYNPGGRLDIVEKIADLLVPEGPIVFIEEKNKPKKIDMSSDENHINIPLVLLVNGYSASASEVLTGAVKDYGVGKVVGSTTYGKGIVQSLIPLSDGSGLKITTAKYYTPSGVCIHGIGIEPDYKVELPEQLKNKIRLTKEEDTQLQKAIEVIKSGVEK